MKKIITIPILILIVLSIFFISGCTNQEKIQQETIPNQPYQTTTTMQSQVTEEKPPRPPE